MRAGDPRYASCVHRRPMTSRRIAASSLLTTLIAFAGCNDAPDVSSRTSAVTGVASQLRGYDLGPPFPAGFRDSGLVNGYAEGEWVPFVAIMEGKKLEDADRLAGASGDGRYGAGIILPTYSPRHDANSISDLLTSGTYGVGPVRPIPNPFDDQWLKDEGYFPFVLGAYANTGDVDLAPVIDVAAQRSGPTRFGGAVGSVSVPIEFQIPAGATRVELRFAIRLAPPKLAPISPDGQPFPGTVAGTAKGAADFFPGPGPIFVGYEVGSPTGIATVPIRVERHYCANDTECPPGEECGGDNTCEEPCTDDSSCPTDEVCEDGACEPPPPPCVVQADCNGNLTCIGGYCVPDCPADTGGGDPEVCDPGTGEPPCVRDDQCSRDDTCEDGVCQPCVHPCDVSCRSGHVCVEGYCQEPLPPPCRGNQCPPVVTCGDQYDCPGGELCTNGVCTPGGGDVKECTSDANCASGSCIGGVCAGAPVLLRSCTTTTACPAGHDCIDSRCTRRPGICELDGDCADSEGCLSGWCGRACTSNASCSSDELCMLDRCVAKCTNVSTCALGEACLGGGCVPELALLGHKGGDQALWDVGFDDGANDGGGCAVAPGNEAPIGLMLFGLALMLAGMKRRPSRRRRL